MSAHVKDERAEHILELCRVRAKRKGCRVKKLRDAGARESVVTAAAWRLILKQRVLGNIRDYENNYADVSRRTLRGLLRMVPACDRALDAERQAYIRSGRKAERRDPEAFDDLRQLAMDGEDAADIERVLEREEFEAEIAKLEEVAEDDPRDQIEAEENERLRVARNTYSESLENIRHRRALFLICADPSASNSTIAARVSMRSVRGIKPDTVRRIRDKLTELADSILTERSEELYLQELERLADIAEAEAKARREEARQYRARWVASLSAKDLEAFRMFANPLCEELGMSLDEMLGNSIGSKT